MPVRLFTDNNYGGRTLDIARGERNLPRGFARAISSVQTTTPAVLFSRAGLQGEALVLESDAAALRTIRGRNFDNRASSILAAPLTIKLNVIVGAANATPARSFDLVNRDVTEANLALARFGINVDVDRLSVGGPGLHTPHTIANFEKERNALRSAEHLNVTYFDGPLYRAVSWRWRVRSARATSVSGRPSATVYTRARYGGNALRVTGDLPEIPESHRNTVFSIALTKSSSLTVYSEPNFGGQARTFHNSVADMESRFGYFDWWRSSTARTTGNTRDWSDFDVWMRPGGSTQMLTWGIGQAVGVNLNAQPTAADAEAAYQHILTNPGVRRATRIG